MAQLAPIQLEDGTIIYIEAEETVTAPPVPPSEELTRTPKGPGDQAIRNFQTMQGTIRTYTAHTLNAFKNMATANVDKVTLEFGIKVAGEGGVPYVTQGSAECNLKITVECSFPD
ncbi:MAG: CU044_2847 family protein [Cyanobacteria bacterium P01_B01_bin.77]